MKKVEVYFLINLGAILSLFAIEGELARYMSRQDDILKNVAQDKLQDLVEISNVESNYEDPDYFRLFFDAATLWGVDYSSTVKDSGTIRSATGVAIDWFTPIGPLSFSLAQPITKDSTDKTESFRFNIGTTF